LKCAPVPFGYGGAKGQLSLVGRILVIGRVLCRTVQSLYNVIRRGQVRIAHAQVDYINASAPGLRFGFIDSGKEVRRKMLYAIGIH
jgi:hypothetical protein